MVTIDPQSLPYREGVGIMLVDFSGKIFVGRRIDTKVEAWQMPQGGLDDGEEPRACALRELEEETGIAPELVEIIAETSEPLYYDLPPELVPVTWGGKYRGQRQIWFLARFKGSDEDIDIATSHPEFCDWKWMEPEALADTIVPFKRKLYRDLAREFGTMI